MISVIIPTYNEEQAIGETLSSLVEQSPLEEVIVCDGGSTDNTLAQVRPYQSRLPLRWLTAPRGRGSQMNVGASGATGKWLLFLHADTLLPPNALRDLAVTVTAKHTDVQAGCFTHRFSGNSASLKLISKLHNWRFSRTKVVYGDQAQFVNHALFSRLGGFPEQPLEDILFSEKLLHITQPVMLPQSITTDARKFQEIGAMRALFYVLGIQLSYELGRPILPKRFFTNYR